MRTLLDRLSEEQLCRLVESERKAGPSGDIAGYVRLLADSRAEFGDTHPFVQQLARVLADWGVATEWPPRRQAQTRSREQAMC